MRGRSALAALGVTGCGLVVGLGEFVPAGDPGSVDDGGKNDGGGATVADATTETRDATAGETDGGGEAQAFGCPAKVDAAEATAHADFAEGLEPFFPVDDAAVSQDPDAGCPPGSLVAQSIGPRNWASISLEPPVTHVTLDLDVLYERVGSGRVAQISSAYKHFVQIAFEGSNVGLSEGADGQESRPLPGSHGVLPGWFHARLELDRSARKAKLIVDGTTVVEDASLQYLASADGGVTVEVGLEVVRSTGATSVHLDNVVIQHF